jgi:hypothetical protein
MDCNFDYLQLSSWFDGFLLAKLAATGLTMNLLHMVFMYNQICGTWFSPVCFTMYMGLWICGKCDWICGAWFLYTTSLWYMVLVKGHLYHKFIYWWDMKPLSKFLWDMILVANFHFQDRKLMGHNLYHKFRPMSLKFSYLADVMFLSLFTIHASEALGNSVGHKEF